LLPSVALNTKMPNPTSFDYGVNSRAVSPPDGQVRLHRARHSGLTLVELLVVIAIIGTLIAILLPAVQAARESSRRLQCANQLKQIATAIHAYNDSLQFLPPGNYASTWGNCPGGQPPVDSKNSEDRANWLIAILPYLENRSLSSCYDAKSTNEDARNQSIRESVVAVYVCPADYDADRLQIPAMGPGAADALNIAYRPGSYRAMAGRSDGFVFLDDGYFLDFPREYRGPIHVVGIAGFMRERFKDIRDGASHTLMVGESTTRTNPGFRTLWAYSHAFYSLSSATPQDRILWGDYDRCRAAGGDGNSFPCRRGWGSNHKGGLNFACCDGSVHFIETTIDMNLFAGLATIDGREVAQAPD
jgi:prepilin-type N-terminal cleavage/methylation domain-containing protein